MTAYTACPKAQPERQFSLPFLRQEGHQPQLLQKQVTETTGETEGFHVRKNNFTQISLVLERPSWRRLNISVLGIYELHIYKFLGLCVYNPLS